LTKDFPIGLRGVKVRALDHLDLTVRSNEVFGLLGPNGSGKSTAIKLVLGLLEPTSGSSRIFGCPSRTVRSRVDVGYLPEAPYFYRHLTGRELVAFFARICGMKGRGVRERVEEVIAWVGMAGAADRRVGTYSKGMLQRIGLAQAMVHDPGLLILDEPTAGVDPIGAAEIGELIVRLRGEGKTILLCSHLLAQVEGVCDRIAILDRGRLVLAGAVRDLVSDKDQVAAILEGFPEVARGDLEGWVARLGARVVSIEPRRNRLDEVFLRHVRGGPAGSPDNVQKGPDDA
jgi:ABC-2 type transport system ATP-binding protein